MPLDQLVLLAEAVVAAFATAAAVLWLCGRPWRAPRPTLVSAGVVIALGLGFYIGYGLLFPPPWWPPREARHRFAVFLFPAILAVELLAAFVRSRILIWFLRGIIAVSAGRVLLHASVYVTDLTGPGSAEWTPSGALLRFGGMAAALAAVWLLLDRLTTREGGRAVPFALSLTCAGAGFVGMLSSYAEAMFILPLAAGLAGVVAASLAFPRQTSLRAAVGPGVLGLFAVLAIGRFFGEVRPIHAVLMFTAPLACWLAQVPPLRRARPWIRSAAGVALVAIPVAFALVQANHKFAEDSRRPSDSGVPTADDYSNFSP